MLRDAGLRVALVLAKPALPPEDIAWRLAFDAARPTELDDAPAPRAVAARLGVELRVAVVVFKPALPPDDMAWRLAFDAARPTELADVVPAAVPPWAALPEAVVAAGAELLKPALPALLMARRRASDAARALPL